MEINEREVHDFCPYDMQDKRQKFYFLGQQGDDFEQLDEQYGETDDRVGNAIDQVKHVHPLMQKTFSGKMISLKIFFDGNHFTSK
jgi:hypothetical protein